jgi:hypothetical protein
MMFGEIIHTFQSKVFNIVTMVSIALYVIIALGLWSRAPQYLEDLQYYVKIYVALFLIYRFNPFRNVKFTNLDRKIAFSAGVFLIGTSFFEYIMSVM